MSTNVVVLTLSGNEFHADVPATEKEQLLNIVLDRGMMKLWVAERKAHMMHTLEYRWHSC